MAVFPTLSKGQDSKYYKVKQENPVMKTELEGGYSVTRARHTRAPRLTFTTGFTDISEADRQTLMAFYAAMRGGSNSFAWIDPVTLNSYTVRFAKEMQFDYDGYGGNHRWNVGDIELEQV